MNIPEILVANSTGAIMVIFLYILRIRTGENKLLGKRIFDMMLGTTLMAQITETISFLIDGRLFPGCYFLQYLCNTLSSGASVLVGCYWVMFVDYRIYRSRSRLQVVKKLLAMPLVVCMIFLISNLFGTGIMFSISPENVYTRGPMNFVLYVTLAIYYTSSAWLTWRAKRENNGTVFFSVLLFVVPSVVGTVLQGLFYGMAFGWMATGVGLVFIHIQVQNNDTFVDELSGLFNRKYMNYYLQRAQKLGKKNLYGIMMDVNDFKQINDSFGHSEGDRAIHEVGTILSSSLLDGAYAMRMGGDEFMVFLEKGSDERLAEMRLRIRERVLKFNETTDAPFKLSLSMGTGRFDGSNVEEFLSDMDKGMYVEKQRYHERNARSKKQ